MNNISYRADERLQFDEYADFLTRSDLGKQYASEDFVERLKALLQNHSVSITARNEEGLLVGACLGITDYAYYLFVIDLGVARGWENHGIGTTLLNKIHEAAGGKDKICMVMDTSSCARDFCGHYGFEHWHSIMVFDKEPWTDMELTPEKLAELKKEAE